MTANGERYDRYESAQGWDESQFNAFSDDESAYFAAELAAAGLTAVQGLNCLDIGFGNGAFMGWSRQQGANCEGIEVNERLLQRAEAHHILAAPTVSELLQKTSVGAYDLIVGFDLLEHLDRRDLIDFLSSLRAVCSSSTILLFRFPNGDNPFSAPLQNGDVTHLTAIGGSMIRQMARSAGFEVVRLSVPSRSSGTSSLQRRLALMLGLACRRFVGLIIRHVFMGGTKVHFSSNLVAVLRTARST